MKKFWLAIIFLALALPAFATTTMVQSNDFTADAAVCTTKGVFYGLWMVTDGTNSVTVTVYDNASAASGRTIFPTTVLPTASDDRARSVSFDPPIKYNNGIYVDITTSGAATYKIYYRDGN